MYLEAYLSAGQDPTNAAISPLFADLTGLPPLLIQVGSGEVFVGEARELSARANAAGVSATLTVAEGMPHIWHLFASFVPEAQEAITQVGTHMALHMRA